MILGIGPSGMAAWDGSFSWGGTDFVALGQLSLSKAEALGGPYHVDELYDLDGNSQVGISYVGMGMKTWCLENQEYFTPSDVYYFTIDEKAFSGGNGNSGDQLSRATEYIVDTWQSAPGTWTSEQIRDGIYFAEDEVMGYVPDLTAYNAAVATGWTKFQNAGHTWALNLWTLTFKNDGSVNDVFCAQSHEITVPAPGALLLGSLGMGLVGWLRRRQAV